MLKSLLDHLLDLRNRHLFVWDLVALSNIPAAALALRVDSFNAPLRYPGAVLIYTLVGLAVRVLTFWRAGLYGRYWPYASVDEIALIFFSVAAATALNTLLFFTLRMLPFLSALEQLPRSLPLIDGMLVLIAVGGSRFSIRLAERWRQKGNTGGRRILIVGAGNAGRLTAREIQNNPQLGLRPVGFVDDDASKQGMKIQGLTVLGGRDAIPQLVRKHGVTQAVIAMPTAPGRTIRRFVELCEAANIEARTIPGIYDLISGRVGVSHIRKVEIEDLLRRQPVQTEIDGVKHMIAGRRVLVTGAGGSIGAELCRQILRCNPVELILLGHGETSIFNITRELNQRASPQATNQQTSSSPSDQPTNHPTISPVIADIRDQPHLEAIFRHHQPHIVFHAAAHKHVPLMERNAAEAVTNNVLGTKCLIETAEAVHVERFVFISTDKAVNPTSVMGATKRVAEKLVGEAARRNGHVFVAVRFGNVLGSRGSVVRIFREQIARGGPVTVTHPEMRRYFMTIPEAVQLVLQAAAIGNGGEVFVLDMGRPVRIVELARDLIKLSGFEPGDDIEIEYCGVRPGEKLFEELITANEVYHRTRHAKILRVSNGVAAPHPHQHYATAPTNPRSNSQPHAASNPRTPGAQALADQVDALVAAARQGDLDRLHHVLRLLVPEYHPPTCQHSTEIGEPG